MGLVFLDLYFIKRRANAHVSHLLLTHKIIFDCFHFKARDVKECEVDFNPEFMARIIPKLDWPEVVKAAQNLGQLGDTPTAPVAAGPGTPRTAASPPALSPDGKLVSIQQLVAQCNHLRVGEKPSKDRLTRVKQLNTSQRAIVQVRGANARR